MFTKIQMRQCKNIYFESIKLDWPYANAGAMGIDMSSSAYCGVSYSDLYFGPTTRNGLAQGWVVNCFRGINLWQYGSGAVNPSYCTIHMNYIHGGVDIGIYTGNSTYLTISENVFANINGDDMQLGYTRWSTFLNNWGSREKYPGWDTGGWKHTDFIQTVSKTVDTPGNQYIGNVMMKGRWTSYQGQALFGNGSILSKHLFENNIILTNSVSGIMYAGSDACHDNVGRYNTCLRLVDDLHFTNLHYTQIRLPGATTISANVQCSSSGDPSAGADGLNIVMKPSDYSASLAYYTSPTMTASFYDLRPVPGKPTHWAYVGAKVGAFQRFYDVIVLGKYPKIGPAAAAWKASYDRANQISS